MCSVNLRAFSDGSTYTFFSVTEKIQSDVVIENAMQLNEYMSLYSERRGGTDFRPAFAYVEQLMRARKFTKLRGLIYFTDGYGFTCKNASL